MSPSGATSEHDDAGDQVSAPGATPRQPAAHIGRLPWPVNVGVRLKLIDVEPLGELHKHDTDFRRPPPPSSDASNLNESWGLNDELRRQEDIAKTLLPVSLAGAGASASVAATSRAGPVQTLFFVVAGLLVLPGLFSMLALSTSPYARNEAEVGPRLALDFKMTLNRTAVLLLWLTVLGAVVAAVLVAKV